jgi:hypothetical protein
MVPGDDYVADPWWIVAALPAEFDKLARHHAKPLRRD